MQPETMRLDGRVAVVIGGTGVLCSRVAETFAKAGARSVIVGRNQEKGRRLSHGSTTSAVSPGSCSAMPPIGHGFAPSWRRKAASTFSSTVPELTRPSGGRGRRLPPRRQHHQDGRRRAARR